MHTSNIRGSGSTKERSAEEVAASQTWSTVAPTQAEVVGLLWRLHRRRRGLLAPRKGPRTAPTEVVGDFVAGGAGW
jgi:hypothetical protein